MTGVDVTIPDVVGALARGSENRLELWATFLDRITARKVAEIGVYRGAFAARMLASCPAIEAYYMIDPWRHLDDWNKPANYEDATLQRFFEEAMDKTRDHERQRVVLRRRTTEVIDQIPDGSLDFAYIDGDHTLQHGPNFEPTLVFPFAVYFAEAAGLRIHGLPHAQFLIEKRPDEGFEFVDLTGKYRHLDLLGAMTSQRTPSVAHVIASRLRRRLRRAWRQRPAPLRPRAAEREAMTHDAQRIKGEEEEPGR